MLMITTLYRTYVLLLATLKLQANRPCIFLFGNNEAQFFFCEREDLQRPKACNTK
ncbi:hypothetical protein RDI58_001781 [Solanum bulbocastanum]|uniref:Uncharacterized protein n=1 Tax=Solanum bulbocastanum TaxID=147425 RepID=A0AAN8UEL2_SOLBU